ncbi:hypothetical protein [Pseudomonas sp. 14A]|uniref:hypothetical protein n=1 Tax=Pseudomonas sp. 14A TaxID=2823142 RepID=UPI001B834AD1|nr:hypothetical protein [Pseudomonas sp. 14A]MBR7198078.1 hypothetical protein [Pseudomonas sp. 14A]
MLEPAASTQDIESRNYSAAGAVTSRYSDNATTPSVSTLVKPWGDGCLYYACVQCLSKGDIAGFTIHQ